MNSFSYQLIRFWDWIVDTGLPLAALIIAAVLIPRVGRLAVRTISQRFDQGEEATKTKLALVGALVYVLEAIAFFVIIMIGLTKLGVPATSAAIPATVVSAAIGFGAQNVIGDFLSGFFIISERQFGVGDYVSFDGTSQDVQGTVVALTLRATRIRTPSGEVVTVPNGSAGVITNFSQEWSRAVVDLAIPLLPDESMDELTQKVETAVERVLKQPPVCEEVTGEPAVLPAMDLVQPLAAGQPWTVSFRTTVDVEPAKQWAVERAVRAALINTFWSRFNSSADATAAQPSFSPTLGGVESSATVASGQAAASAAGLTAGIAAGSVTEGGDAEGGVGVTGYGADAAGTGVAGEIGTQRRKTGAESGIDDAEMSRAAQHSGGDRAIDDGPGRPLHKEKAAEDLPPEADSSAPESSGVFLAHDYETRIKRFLSFGGRTRVSTTVLFIALFLIGGLSLLASDPEDGPSGVLSPSRWEERFSGGKNADADKTSEEKNKQPQQKDQQPTHDSDRTQPDSTGRNSTDNSRSSTDDRFPDLGNSDDGSRNDRGTDGGSSPNRPGDSSDSGRNDTGGADSGSRPGNGGTPGDNSGDSGSAGTGGAGNDGTGAAGATGTPNASTAPGAAGVAKHVAAPTGL